MTTYAQIERQLSHYKPINYSFRRAYDANMCIEQERYNGRVFMSEFFKLMCVKYFR